MQTHSKRKSSAWWDWETSKPSIRRTNSGSSKLQNNYIPPAIAVLLYLVFIWYLYPVKDLVSLWIFKFVELLQITKVLKLSLLTDKRLYDYTALVIILYIGFAFFLDLFRFLSKNLLQKLSWDGEAVVFSRWGLLGKITVRWNPNQTGLQILHKGGWVRKILGLEKILFRVNVTGTEESTLAESPFFSSTRNNAFLSSIFKNS
ncbi:hypothetical protein EHQ53_15470 [Leptospira langatensis]|uniref:Uncharacterized protein n=1 Tax=Leptospira langatensis TaxID=2484983 RepID=A0A5F1ZQ77_9LEPT|nr:hypothetical protein [Leptospira langatensis]TGK01865.1 hypothetical protein EHO57_08710 [Leptospira langatensis]TGL39470.1 hypothetical protein EHQ53_15470 [Leptospira langatensis]